MLAGVKTREQDWATQAALQKLKALSQCGLATLTYQFKVMQFMVSLKTIKPPSTGNK
jgi:hypothetical protein